MYILVEEIHQDVSRAEVTIRSFIVPDLTECVMPAKGVAHGLSLVSMVFCILYITPKRRDPK